MRAISANIKKHFKLKDVDMYIEVCNYLNEVSISFIRKHNSFILDAQ